MSDRDGFSQRIELPHIAEGPGVAIIEDGQGRVLQVVMSSNIRRRIGNLLDSEGTVAVRGPRIYQAQQRGQSIFVRWKLTPHYKRQKRRLMEELKPLWAP